MIPTLTLLVAAAHAAPSHGELEAAAWEELGTRNHSEVGTVQILSASVGGLPCYQAVADTDVSTDVLLAIVSDPVAAMEWSSTKVSEAEILDRQPGHIDYYQHLQVPGWTMVQDRFWFSRGSVVHGEGWVAWQYQKLEEGGPHRARWEAHRAKHPKAVEPPVSVGTWKLAPTGSGTHIAYKMCTDVGGTLPGPVERVATRRTLPDTVADLVREGRRRSE